MAQRIELGCPGHFIASADCRFRRHTQVGDYRVSTVGDLYFKHEPGKRQRLGASENSYFETMVFRTTAEPEPESEGCGCRAIADWSELDGERYATAGAAQAGHGRYVAKYLRLAKKETK